MKNQHEADVEVERGTRRARILWRDEASGELLWLVLTGTNEFLEELGHSGYDLRRMPDAPRPGPTQSTPHAA